MSDYRDEMDERGQDHDLTTGDPNPIPKIERGPNDSVFADPVPEADEQAAQALALYLATIGDDRPLTAGEEFRRRFMDPGHNEGRIEPDPATAPSPDVVAADVVAAALALARRHLHTPPPAHE